MAKMVATTGNEAVANALRQVNPDVCATYPITPQTDMMQRFAQYSADGEVDTEVILVESEHSSMSACIGASAAGGRVITATSSQGLALMWEMLHIAAGMNLPIVMPLVNRALSAPLNIHGDHSDGMGARDTGWIQLWSENAQDAYDNAIMAFRIAEHMDIRLPIMINLDGFIISHSIESMQFLEDKVVKDFVGEFTAVNPLLDLENPKSYGPLILTDLYHEYKKLQHETMKKVPAIVKSVSAEFAKISGREYGLFDSYRMEDADVALVIMGSAAGTSKDVVDEMRSEGIKAGLIRPRLFRPFPYEDMADELKSCKAICVMDRADSFGGYGPMFMEVSSAMYQGASNPKLINRIYGLGGRDYMHSDARGVFEELIELAKGGDIKIVKEYIGVRE